MLPAETNIRDDDGDSNEDQLVVNTNTDSRMLVVAHRVVGEDGIIPIHRRDDILLFLCLSLVATDDMTIDFA